jgi:biotin carboxyl carrier protein
VRIRTIVVLVLMLALGGGAVVVGLPYLTPRPDEIPTTRPVRGDVAVEVHTIGDLRAMRSAALTAPATGGTLQLLTLPPSGSIVKKDEIVIQFDLAEQQYNLEQAKSELNEALQEIAKLEADARVQAADDQVKLLEARYALRRAELKVTGNEFVGAIEAKKNELAVDEASRTLAQVEDDARTHAASNQASAAVLEEKRRKAQLGMDFAQKNIESMTITSPIDGLVVTKENRDASGGFFTPGMSLPDYRPGDAVQPGRVVAEIVDLAEMEIRAKVDETDRPALSDGSPATVKVEALGTGDLGGSAKGVSGLASRDFWDIAATRQFDAAFKLDRAPAALRPGMTARVLVRGDTLKNVLHLPRQALFQKNGRPVVYVRDGDGFKPIEVKVLRITETRVVLENLPPTADVALSDPDAVRGGATARSASAIPGGA